MARHQTFCSLLALTLLLVQLSVAVSAERRLALVIGNSAYSVSRLKNPIHDATDMAETLKKLGFETTLLLDATFRQMEDSIDSFSRKLRQGGVGLFYYAGHGVQAQGNNYLIPVDARLKDAADLKYEAVHAGWVLERMADAGNEVNIIILDACRDNAFARGWRLVQRGLAVMEAGQGSLIAYSTVPGGTALDGLGRNGTYTRHLLRFMTEPNLPIERMFQKVRIAVRDETQGKQIPWESSSLLGSFSFIVPKKQKLTVQATPADSTIKLENSKLDYRPGVELAPGRYDLVVTRDGYKPARRTVVVSTADVTLDVALDVVKYKLTVQATPADSTVKFDNSKLDYRPGLELAPGRYDLVVAREGYKPARRQVTVSTTDVTLKVALELEKYKLTVQATPPDSTVKLANSKAKYQPGMEVPPGRYEVVVARQEYKPARRTVTVSNADVTLDVVLEPEKTTFPRI
jgi:Caspase domain/PEGA domain